MTLWEALKASLALAGALAGLLVVAAISIAVLASLALVGLWGLIALGYWVR